MTTDQVQPAVRSFPTEDDLNQATRALVRSAAACAAFCEHIEHNEPTTTHEVVAAAQVLRDTAAQLAHKSGLSLCEAYAARIRGVEETSLLRYTSGPEGTELAGARAAAAATRWDEIQAAQLIHDRQFHPDVFGLSKVDQLRHYTFHVTKLAGLLVDAIDQGTWDSFRDERLADVAVFGIKLATVCNERLPALPIDVT
ncbi:MAG: hypothetical protein OXG30_05860 [bacterium]|nr:hypothetical protein [bacterium]